VSGPEGAIAGNCSFRGTDCRGIAVAFSLRSLIWSFVHTVGLITSDGLNRGRSIFWFRSVRESTPATSRRPTSMGFDRWQVCHL